jgi:hypothetical protein
MMLRKTIDVWISNIVIYSKSEEDKAFVHGNCMFVHPAELRGGCNSSERKRPSYSQVLYLVLFDTSLEIESVTLYSKFEIKISHIFGRICCYGKK